MLTNNRSYSGASYCTVADAKQLPAGTERESAVTLGSIIAASTMIEAYLGGQALYRPVTRFTWTCLLYTSPSPRD